jgi:AcrR family transcriptional regulator
MERSPFMVDPLVAAEGPADPRLARSRNRLLEAAGQLLSTGGVEAWLAMGPVNSGDASRRDLDPGAVVSLRARVIEQYRRSLDQILTAPDARAVLGEIDTTFALIQLLGPIVFARLTGLRHIHADDCIQIVDNFLAAHAASVRSSTSRDHSRPRPAATLDPQLTDGQ